MEQIIFPVPGICEFLTKETKYRLFTTTEQDEQGSKVSDFFDQSSFLHNEMEWQKKLRSKSRPDLPLGSSPQRGHLGQPPLSNGEAALLWEGWERWQQPGRHGPELPALRREWRLITTPGCLLRALAQFLASLKRASQPLPWDCTCRCFPLSSLGFSRPLPSPGSGSYRREIKPISPHAADLLRCFQGCSRMGILA